jgi:hypothetical protein
MTLHDQYGYYNHSEGSGLSEEDHAALDHSEVPGIVIPTLDSDRIIRTAGDYASIDSATFVDVDATNLQLSLTTGAHRVLLGVVGVAFHTTNVVQCAFTFSVDGTDLATWAYAHFPITSYQAINGVFMTDVLSAGAHTFRLSAKNVAATAGASDPRRH